MIQRENEVMTNNQNRYRQCDGKSWIEIRVKNLLRLFDARDPAPFRDRCLDDDFVEYIISSMREFSYKTAIKIIIYIEEYATADLSHDAIRDAFKSFWSYQIELLERELKIFFKRAQLFMLIGIAVLVICITIAQNITAPGPGGYLGVIREGIVIFGWVSIWKPIELLLFDWFPLFEKLRLYRKLLITEVEISSLDQMSHRRYEE